MRSSFSHFALSLLVCFLAGCGDQVQTGCPPIIGSNGMIMVYKRQQEGQYAVFIRCNGQDQFQLLSNYGYQSCPSPVDQATLVTVIEVTCAGSPTSTQSPDSTASWTYPPVSSSSETSTIESTPATTETTTAEVSTTQSSESTTPETTTTTTEESTTTTTTTTESSTTESVTSVVTV